MRHAVDNGMGLKELAFEGNKFADGYGITHPRKYLDVWDEAYKNSRKIYEIVAGTFDPFEFKKTGSQFSLVNGKAVETIITEQIPLAEIKEREKNNVSSSYSQILNGRPRVDSGIGFFVDGGRADLDNFEQKAKRMTDTSTTGVKDADNAIHEGITKAQMEQIADNIFQNGENTLLEKWAKQAAIDTATTVQEVRDAIQ